ncbi:MAG: tRNA 2-thiouridine(34) synthase MnmA [Phycisphaerales bacterium]
MSGRKPKVLVAMSGGVDSSVAAALLVRAGYECVGVFMRLGSPGETLDELRPADEACAIESPANAGKPIKIGHQGCCSINDAADARLVAAELGIPFYVVNFKKDFGRIIDYFVDEYASGRTPNPCVRCNDWLKFGKLHEYARQIDADFVASGHYARVGEDGQWAVGRGQSEDAARPDCPLPKPHCPSLLRGLDRSKDQSYVLFGVPREQLRHMLLPIGEYEKPIVREMAQRFGLPTFDKPDSQEICFVPDNDYAGLVERRRPELAAHRAGADAAGQAVHGHIIDASTGAVVGTHAGQHRFTIGQRRGLSLSLGHPVYVVDRDAATNTVSVGPKEMLLSSACTAGEANWLVDEARFAEWSAVEVKYRYNTPPVRGRVRLLPEAEQSVTTPSGRLGRFEVRFEEPQSAVAPGQAVVLYEGDVVLGGGWVEGVSRS